MITINFKGEQNRLRVTNVILEVERDKWNYMKMFHCHQCRTPLFKYSGIVVALNPGMDEVDLPVIIQCPTCKLNLNIISIVESI